MSTELTEHLTAAMEQLSDDINGLMEVAEQGTLLQQLVDEIRVLRAAIDDLRAEVEWAARNVLQSGEPRDWPRPITSLPRDPCDPEFAAKLNAVARHELPTDGDEPMFDDDAGDLDEECDALEDSGARDAPAPQPQPPAIEESAALPPQPTTEGPVATPAERATIAKKQPLATRLFLHRHLADLVRLLGHEEHLAEDLQHMVQPLYERHGAETVRAAIDELVRFEHRERQAFARLQPEVQKLAVQIIGRPPPAR